MPHPCQQDDVLIGTLTVFETIFYSAKLRLPRVRPPRHPCSASSAAAWEPVPACKHSARTCARACELLPAVAGRAAAWQQPARALSHLLVRPPLQAMPSQDKVRVVEDVIKELGLESTRDT